MNPCNIFSILLALHCMVCAGLGKARRCRHLHEVFGSLRAGLTQSFAVCLICVSWLLQETLSLPMDVVFDTDHKDYCYKLYHVCLNASELNAVRMMAMVLQLIAWLWWRTCGNCGIYHPPRFSSV